MVTVTHFWRKRLADGRKRLADAALLLALLLAASFLVRP